VHQHGSQQSHYGVPKTGAIPHTSTKPPRAPMLQLLWIQDHDLEALDTFKSNTCQGVLQITNNVLQPHSTSDIDRTDIRKSVPFTSRSCQIYNIDASVNSQVVGRFGSMTACLRITASSDTLCENQGAAESVRRSDREIDEYWSTVVMEEPVSDDLKALVRADLMKVWHFRGEMEFRENIKTRWATTDYFRITLEDSVGKVEPRKSKYLCNKPTAFYWLQSAQQADASRQRTQTPKIIFAAI